MLTLLLLACSGAPDDTAADTAADDTAACTDTTGTLRVCVWMEEGSTAPLAGVKAWVSADPKGTDGIQALTGDDGCVDYTLDAGTWWAWGEDEVQGCRSWPEEVSVSACTVTPYDTYIYMGCVDGG